MKKNAKILIVGTVILMIVLIFYTNNKVKDNPKPVSKYDELMLIDLENEYPDNPSDIIKLNNEIIKYLYSRDITEDEIESLITLQRQLFATTFLELNPINTQIEQLKEQIKVYKKNKLQVSDTKISPPEYNTNNYAVCIIKSLYYMTKGNDIYRTYTLIKEHDKAWKIYSWEDSTDSFISVEDLNKSNGE